MCAAKQDFWSVNWRSKGQPVRIEKYYAPNVKNFLDDSIKDTLTHFHKISASHRRVDTISAMQAICIALAILAFVDDKLFPYPASHSRLVGYCVAYFLLYWFSLLCDYLFLRGCILRGHEKEPTGMDLGYDWNVCTRFRPLVAQMRVELRCVNRTNGKSLTETVEQHVGKWIATDGEVLCRKVQKDISAAHDRIIKKLSK